MRTSRHVGGTPDLPLLITRMLYICNVRKYLHILLFMKSVNNIFRKDIYCGAGTFNDVHMRYLGQVHIFMLSLTSFMK